MSELHNVLDGSIGTRTNYSESSPPPTAVSSVLNIRVWPIRRKRKTISFTVSDNRHDSESIIGRNNSPLDSFHPALLYKLRFAAVGIWGHVSMHKFIRYLYSQ